MSILIITMSIMYVHGENFISDGSFCLWLNITFCMSFIVAKDTFLGSLSDNVAYANLISWNLLFDVCVCG